MKFNKQLFMLAILGGLSVTAVNAQNKKTKNSKMNTTETKNTTAATSIDSVSYALGVNIAQNLKTQGLENLNIEMLSKAFNDYMKGLPLMVSQENAESVLNQYFMKMQTEKAEKSKRIGEAFLAENKKKKDVVTLPSGLQYTIIKEGTGEIPKETDKVTTHYHGTLIDGTVFDSSVDRGQPASFPVNGVIKGWVEALQLMKTGSKWKLFIPSDLAYGERGAGAKIGPGSTLIFEIELISIDK
jgi:FKBP-type peptidyl-prolyl cis-trans isomerase FklB